MFTVAGRIDGYNAKDEDVLCSRITAGHISSKRFSQAEFSIGLGALGDRLDDYLPVLGEMINIGGTMVWLPTDGHDTPDYLMRHLLDGSRVSQAIIGVSYTQEFQRDPAGQRGHV